MTFLHLGFNLSIVIMVTFTVALIIFNLMGLIYIWNIFLNAVSLVNVVMYVQIAEGFKKAELNV